MIMCDMIHPAVDYMTNVMSMWISNHKNLDHTVLLEYFSKCTTMAIMTILASEALLHENKKFHYQNFTPLNLDL